ncbi:hypothetical protein H5410_012304, partial [Solanum commersonii]
MTLLSIASTSLSSVTIRADYYYEDEYGKCELKISCPNLKFLNYEAPMPKDIIIENLFSIQKMLVSSLPIHGMYKATSKERFSLVSFYKLKTLKLYARVDGDFIQAMIFIAQNVRWSKNWQMHDLDEKSIVCLESHLKSICLTNFKGVENEIKLYPDKSEEALVEVLKFPTTSSQVVLTFLNAKPQPSSLSTRKPKVSSTGTGIDRISSLPDDVLHNFLSSLFIFDVVQLSVLSKRWRYVWTTMPYLHFDIDQFYPQRYCDFVIAGRFKYFINWVLISQGDTNKLVQFLLCFDNLFDEPTILRWINHLKLLHLEQVQLSDEHLISCLLSKCDFLKTLILEDFTVGDMTLLDIASMSLINISLRNNISKVECHGNCEIRISCPSLKVLKYNAPVPKDIVVENLFSIEVVRINLIDSGSIKERGIMLHEVIKKVHHSTSVLKLCMTSISGLYDVARRIKLSPVSFDKLKSLKLEVVIHEESMQIMILLLKYSPNLEVLKLWSDELLDLDESIVCLESHLKSTHLTGFKGEENEIELVKFFLKNARVLEKLMIFWEMDMDKSEEASEEVLNFHRTSSHVVLMFLDAKPKQRS